MTDRLTGKNILVTGASSGIGRALALDLAQRGNRVIIAARSQQALQELAALQPGRLIPLVWDVTDAESGEAVRRFVSERFGWLDIVVLNAGTCEYIDDGRIDVALVRRVMEVNFFGALQCAQVLMPLLERAPQRPYLVCVASMSTYFALARAEAYGASKAALQYFFEALRVDLATLLDVSVISPGFVRTPLTDRNDFPMPFIVDVDTAVRCIVRGMQRRRLHIEFPRRLGWSLKLLALLPQRLRLRVAGVIAGR